jgi:hypothetical protein
MPLPKGFEWSDGATRMQNNGYVAPSFEEIEADKEEYNASEQLFSEWDWQNEQGLGPQGEALPELAIGWKPNGEADFGTGLQGWWNKAQSNVRSAWETGYKEGLQISGITKLAVQSDYSKADQDKANQKLEQMQESRKPKDENQALWAASIEATKEGFNQALWGLLDGLSFAGQISEQVLGTAGYTIADAIDPNRDVNEQTFKENWNASRMAYSSIFDASIYEEMNRRIDEGMRPDLAQQEVMIEKKWTMWPELIGQMVFDPLNVISVFGKAGAQAKLAKNASKTFHEVTNPAVLKMLDDISEAAKLDDATAYQRIDEIVKSQQALVTAASHAEDIAQAGKDLETLSNSFKLGSLTRDGKIAHIANETGEILMHVVNNSDPSEALEIIRGMVRSVDSDPAVAAEGISAMLHFADPKALFSKAGNDTTVMLSRMAAKYGDNWLKNIEALKGNPAELTKDLMSKLDEVGEEMFPSVSKMLEAEKAVKAGGEINAATRALADRAAQLPQYVKNATRFHDTAQRFVGPINKFFIGAYMGWSPGFAFRNFSNNSLQLLIDYGPGVLLGKADDMFAKAEKLHGGLLQGAFSEGGMAASLFPEKAVMQETGAKAIVEAAKQKGLSGPVLGMSQTLEANAAKRIIAKTYRQTFDKGVKAMVKAVTPALQEAGFSEDIIKKLPTYILNHDGDATKVINALREDISSGVIDLFNDVSRIDPKYKSFLSDAGKWDEYAETVLRAPTREAAQTAAQKIFDDLAQAGDYAYRDARPVVDNYDKYLKMAEKNGLPEQRGMLVSLRKTENRKAIQAAEEILSEADNLGASLGLRVGDMKKARGITGLNTWGNDAAKEADRINDLAWKLTNDAKKAGSNLQKMWLSNQELFTSPPPQGLTSKSFLDALWHSYDQVVSKTWGGARDTAIENVTGYLDDLKKAGAEIPDQWRQVIKTAQEGAQQYDNAMVGRFGELVEETPMAYGTRTSQINALANQAGIPTATAEGLALDKKTLAVINKYADVTYKSLEDVPLDVAKEAFAKKAGKATKAVQPELAPAGVTMQEATQIPRGELPPEVSTRFEQEANRLLDELNSGTGPTVQQPRQGTDAFETTVTPSTNVDWYRELPKNLQNKKTLTAALEKIVKNKGSDKGVNVERLKELIIDRFRYGSDGAPPDLKVLKALGADDKVLQSALDDYNDFTKQELTLDELLGGADEVADDLRNPDLPYYDDAGNLVEPARKRILPPPTDGEMPTIARAIHDQMGEVSKMRQWVMDDITKNFGKKAITNKIADSALNLAEKELKQKLAETKLISSRVAQANRDFTLLNYGQKSYWDVSLAYLYPFHFWYGGTYKNWMKRIAQNPAILGHYARYKDILGTVHAGMPEWWKYNINSNDLPGVDVENPLYFNLEATLWPLNGITGTDFNDPSKRVNWWTHTLDYMNKFGPSTWTPLSMMTGLSLYAQGEREAGEKWMGRIFPQSNVIKAGASMLGIANLETDPFVGLLQGGLDPYERRRVDRALAQMQQEAEKGGLPYTPEQILDAAYTQEGEIWDEAVKRAVRGRAPSQISSYLFGVGFKGRTQEDMEVDKFFGDYSKLFTMRANLSPEEFREGMDALKSKYPFMDTVMLSRRDGVERDAGLAYMVLNRIPPGKSSDIAKAAGIDSALMSKFYDDKGAIDKWAAGDRAKFMSGVLNIAAVLEIPSDMTRAEWTKAKNAYSGLTNEAKKQFGDDIMDMVDGYYQKKTVSQDAANAYLEENPQVEQYMNWKSQRVMESPLLSAYYGGASMIENYYRSQQYAAIEKELGKEIFDIIAENNDLKTYGDPGEAKQFYNQNKAAIRRYYQLKDEWAMTINQQTAQLSAHIPEGEGVSIREDIDVTNLGAQQLAGALQEPEAPTFEEFQSQVPERLMNLILDYYNQDEPLPESAQRQLDRIANEMGYQYSDELLRAIGTSLYAQQP